MIYKSAAPHTYKTFYDCFVQTIVIHAGAFFTPYAVFNSSSKLLKKFTTQSLECNGNGATTRTIFGTQNVQKMMARIEEDINYTFLDFIKQFGNRVEKSDYISSKIFCSLVQRKVWNSCFYLLLYQSLAHTLKQVRNCSEIVVLMGDVNAKLGDIN